MNKISTDAIWMRDEIDSPCVKLCVIHPRVGICAGCYRTLDEIAEWSTLSAEARQSVTAALPDRATLLKKRRGGREARLNEA